MTAPRTSTAPPALIVALVGVLTACSAASPDLEPGSGAADTIATGLEAPWSIAFLDNTSPDSASSDNSSPDSTAALVSARDSGEILEVTGESTRVVGTVDGVEGGGESGLLGLATRERDLYVYSTGADGNRIERYTVDGGPGSLSLGQGETVIDGLPATSYHSGGRIAFGPDGMLYATVGDAGSGEHAQDLDSLAGKILRLTPDGDVPADNPFDDSPVYSYGHRNPQGIAWAEDGTMFSSEFGEDTWDELNVIEAGANYGWPHVEGAADDTAGDRFVDPVQQWAPDEASPSGIEIVDGTIHIANLRGEVLRTVPVADPTSSQEHLAGEYGRLRDVARTPGGEIWVLTNNTDGRGSPADGDDRILRLRR